VVDEMELLKQLSAMLVEYKDDEEAMLMFLTAVMTELEGHIPLQKILDALAGVLEVKYVWDELDNQFFAKMLKKMFKLKSGGDRG